MQNYNVTFSFRKRTSTSSFASVGGNSSSSGGNSDKSSGSNRKGQGKSCTQQ